ncbi:ribulose-phosphate 3-epimerase [Candidatus Peregrinibacteria bacterium]|nr:ribulose-phosphate 3-epimerase [Candidatus Peregrinibacteria bacterium]
MKNNLKLKIAPSILSADFGKLNEEISQIAAVSDILHIDVMDGHFVPNISFGAPVMKCIKTFVPLDVHLMIDIPSKYVDDFVKAGADRIIFHAESKDKPSSVIDKIILLGAKPAIAIKPMTPVSAITEFLPMLDMVLVMTVEPGFGGQAFMPEMIEKIKKLRALGFDKDIGVDGGINAETAKICRDAGANLLVAGNYVFGAKDRVKAVESLR